MPKFTLSPKGDEPYRNLKFRIKSDNKYVAGLNQSKVLEKDMEGAGSPSTIRRLPVKKRSDAIILTAGMTRDTAFEDWANLCNNFQGDATMSLKNFRKNIIIDVFNEANQKTISYRVNNCWVSEYQAVPDLDAGANVVMIQTMKLENEGWERV
jgi:phage tail-like protein